MKCEAYLTGAEIFFGVNVYLVLTEGFNDINVVKALCLMLKQKPYLNLPKGREVLKNSEEVLVL